MEIFFCTSCSLEMALRSLSSGVPAGITIFSTWQKATALIRRDEARITLRAGFMADLLGSTGRARILALKSFVRKRSLFSNTAVTDSPSAVPPYQFQSSGIVERQA